MAFGMGAPMSVSEAIRPVLLCLAAVVAFVGAGVVQYLF